MYIFKVLLEVGQVFSCTVYDNVSSIHNKSDVSLGGFRDVIGVKIEKCGV